MRPIPDAILDKLENREHKQKPKDGQMWYNPNPKQTEYENSGDEIHELYQNREQRIRQQFRTEFYPRSARYIMWVLVSVVTLSSIQWGLMGFIEAQTIGITTTIVGSVILGLSLLKGPHSVIKETRHILPSMSGENMDAETLEYVCTTIDGINGIFYLILGFIIQLLSVFNI